MTCNCNHEITLLVARILKDDVVEAVQKTVADAMEEATPRLSRMITVDECGEILSVHPSTVRRAIDCGKLRATRVLGALRIDRADVETFVREQSK